MNITSLFESIGLLQDAPEVIQRFRKLVVALAITGRLETADCVETSFDAIVNEISKIKHSLRIKSDLTHQTSELSTITIPNIFSNSSIFIQLGSVARIEKGQTAIMKAKSGLYPLVVTGANRLSCDHFDFDGAAAIVPLVSSAGHGTASLHRLHYQEGKFALGNILAAVFPLAPDLVSARFLFEYLSAFKEELLVSRMIGTANVSLSIGKVAEVPVPLLSRAVQTKVDGLMALCDRLETTRGRREATRDKLTAASLARLSSPNPDTYVEDARFALDALPALTARPDQVKQLRQTIFNLAVCGKLVPQDSAEGTGGDLIREITSARLLWERQGRIRKVKSPEPPISEEEIYLDLPPTWVWARIAQLGKTQTGSTPSSDDDRLFGNFIPFIKPADLDRKEISYDGSGLSKTGIEHSRLVPAGSVLMVCIGATLGKINTTTREICFNQQINSITPFLEELSEFTALALKGSAFQALAWSKAGTGTLPIISKGKWELLPIPLPPLAEQHRIVTKIGELMTLCDDLEASLSEGDNKRRRLLDALLAEALAADQSYLERAA